MNQEKQNNRENRGAVQPGQENRQAFGTEETNTNHGNQDLNQVHDTRGDAQNVNDDQGRPLNEKETGKARNKASEGINQGRNRS